MTTDADDIPEAENDTHATPERAIIDRAPVPFDKILLGYNSRQNYLGIDELADDIQENDLIEAIVVQADKEREGFFVLRAGFRRYKAIQRLRLRAKKDDKPLPFEHVPAREIVNVSELDAIIINLAENHGREDLSTWEQGTTFRMLRERYHLTANAIAKRVGYSRAHVTACISVVEKIHPTIVQYLKNGQVVPQNLLFAWRSMPLPKQLEEFDRWRKIPLKKRGPMPLAEKAPGRPIRVRTAERLEEAFLRKLQDDPQNKELIMGLRTVQYVLRKRPRPPVKTMS